MQLSHLQKQTLHRDGCVHLPGVIPQVMVDHARRLINHSLGESGIDPAQLPILRARSYCPEMREHPDLLALLTKTPAWELVESAIGIGKVAPPIGLQIALRFPKLADPPPAPRPHIDGVAGGVNGVPPGTIQHFTGLLGVLLSDLPNENAGNFTVWPGTHHAFADHFRQHGPQTLLTQGMSAVPLPTPRQITGKAGDVVLCHYLLAHGIAPNTSPNIRYAAFFRLTHINHDAIGNRCMTEPWLEWEGMRDIATPSDSPPSPVPARDY
jgi:hypothetical protein